MQDKRGRRGLRIAILAIAISALAVLGIGGTYAANADAAVLTSTTAPTTLTATTQITNRPDNGHGTPALWSYDDMARTVTVTQNADQSKAATGTVLYTATITDKGTFSAIQGAGAPNGSLPAKIAHAVTGDLNGTYALTVVAPTGDTLTGNVPATEDDQFSATSNGFVSTGNWVQQAFADSSKVTVTGGAYNWTYTTACEKWVDSSSNGDGNFAADGNITGKVCPAPPVTLPPFVYSGNVVKVDNNTATVSWSESDKGWPDSGSKCVEVWISGYGFGQWDQSDPTNPGTAHVGFTCDHSGNNVGYGYLRGLTRGHTYAERVVPSTGTYGDHHPIPGALVGYVDVFTTNVAA